MRSAPTSPTRRVPPPRRRLAARLTRPRAQVVGYLLEELRDAKNFAEFKKDVARCNLFIGSLIFIEELADKVVEAVTPHRDNMDACLIFPSMPAVMRLNKLGTFSMAQLGQSKSAIASFMKKRREAGGSGFEDSMLKLVRTLPKVRCGAVLRR